MKQKKAKAEECNLSSITQKVELRKQKLEERRTMLYNADYIHSKNMWTFRKLLPISAAADTELYFVF